MLVAGGVAQAIVVFLSACHLPELPFNGVDSEGDKAHKYDASSLLLYASRACVEEQPE